MPSRCPLDFWTSPALKDILQTWPRRATLLAKLDGKSRPGADVQEPSRTYSGTWAFPICKHERITDAVHGHTLKRQIGDRHKKIRRDFNRGCRR